MINFDSKKFLKLAPVDNDAFSDLVNGILVSGESVVQTFKSGRDGVVFTDRRLIAINVQGVTGKKKTVSVLPFDKVQAFEVETPATFDIDSTLTLWFSGVGQVDFEFSAKANVTKIMRCISERMLG